MHTADLLAGCAFPSKQRLLGRDVAAPSRLAAPNLSWPYICRQVLSLLQIESE